MCAAAYSIPDRTPTQTVLNRWIGRRFGRLTVITFHAYTKNHAMRWECRCDCGKTSIVSNTNLVSGRTNSCGCRKADHGLSHSRAYRVWHHMIERCKKPGVNHWERYGGRGISVCERWHSFANFYSDMGEPADGLSIDRINNDGNYEPSNCRWATTTMQARNRSDTVIIEFSGRSQALCDWAAELGLSAQTLQSRISRGWSVERALLTPPRKYTVGGAI